MYCNLSDASVCFPVSYTHLDVYKRQIANRTDPAKGNDSGMAGVYSVHDGSITLAGTPAKPGIYDISVTITDELGRTATSNTLPFRIYSGEETLHDQLTLANCTKTADGKYMYRCV